MNLTAFVYHMILKVHEILCEYVQKSYCWFLCFLDQLHKRALKSVTNSALQLSKDSCSFFSLRDLSPVKDFSNHIFPRDLPERLQSNSFLDGLLNVGSQVFVLEARQGPEAEIHEIKYEQLQKRQLGLLAGVMKIILLEFFARLILLGQLVQFILIDADVLGMSDHPVAGGPDQLTAIRKHIKERY